LGRPTPTARRLTLERRPLRGHKGFSANVLPFVVEKWIKIIEKHSQSLTFEAMNV
jgi:hypothetical protein